MWLQDRRRPLAGEPSGQELDASRGRHGLSTSGTSRRVAFQIDTTGLKESKPIDASGEVGLGDI
jgi:hypothetical protein